MLYSPGQSTAWGLSASQSIGAVSCGNVRLAKAH
jgi:hypothetical protein